MAAAGKTDDVYYELTHSVLKKVQSNDPTIQNVHFSTPSGMITFDDVQSLIEALSTNTNLSRLNLELAKCAYTAKQTASLMKALGASLANSGTGFVISLARSQIGDSAFLEFASSYETHIRAPGARERSKYCFHIVFEHNDITDVGAAAALKFMEDNPTTALGLTEGNKISEDLLARLTVVYEANAAFIIALGKHSTSPVRKRQADVKTALSEHEQAWLEAIDKATSNLSAVKVETAKESDVDEKSTHDACKQYDRDLELHLRQMEELRQTISDLKKKKLAAMSGLEHRNAERAARVAEAEAALATSRSRYKTTTSALKRFLEETDSAASAELAQLSQRDIEDMDSNDVLFLLQCLKLDDQVPLSTLKEHGVDGAVLADLTESDMEVSLGISRFGDRRRLSNAIERLRNHKPAAGPDHPWPVCKWSVEETATWAAKHLVVPADFIRTHAICGEVLVGLSRDDLRSLGITNLKELTTAAKAIASLRC